MTGRQLWHYDINRQPLAIPGRMCLGTVTFLYIEMSNSRNWIGQALELPDSEPSLFCSNTFKSYRKCWEQNKASLRTTISRYLSIEPDYEWDYWSEIRLDRWVCEYYPFVTQALMLASSFRLGLSHIGVGLNGVKTRPSSSNLTNVVGWLHGRSPIGYEYGQLCESMDSLRLSKWGLVLIAPPPPPSPRGFLLTFKFGVQLVNS